MNSNTPVIQSENISASPEVSAGNISERRLTDFVMWKNFALWSGLALIGQASSLQMINAGQTIHFQHYRSIQELLNNNFLPLVLFAIQTVIVSIGISSRLSVIKNWLTKTFSWWQLIAILLFAFLAGAAVTRDVSIYLSSLLTSALVQSINLGNLLLVVCAVPDNSIEWVRGKIEQILGESVATEKAQIDRFAVVSALWVVLLTGTLSYFVYQNHPHVPDESIYLFQANYMAAGQLTSKTPLVPEAFSIYMIPTQDSRWFSIFPPAWSALLAVGVKLNLEWLINPLLAGICILLSYVFFQDFYSRRFARIGIILLCCSPWFIFMAMSFMSHIFTLVCALGATVLLNRAFKKTKIGYALAAGLLVGILSLIRPFDGAMVAGLLGILTLIKCPTWKTKILTSAALIIGTISTAALVFPYNQSVTGNSFLLPMDAYYTKYFWKNANSLGFGSDRGMGWALDAFPGHSPLEAVLNAALNTFSVNIELFGWGFSSLILAVCLIFSGNLRKKDIWAILTILVVVGGFSLFWYHGGPDFGARYWFLCIIPLIALTTRGIEWLSEKTTNQNQTQLNPRVFLAFAMLCTISLISYFPWRSLNKYYHYLGMRPDIRELAKQHNFGKSLVLIRGNEHPDYQSAWNYNPVNFEGDVPIYAWDKTPEIRNQLLQSYQDRKIWIIDAPSITNNDYKIVQGPIEASELLKVANQ